MKTKLIKTSIVIATAFVFSTGFTYLEDNSEVNNAISVTNNEELYYTVLPSGLQDDYVIYPKSGDMFIGFKEALAFKESRGKYNSINTFGYIGKYQFGKSALRQLKIYNRKEFLYNSELQENAFIALCAFNKWVLKKDIKKSVGKKINGVKVTESGILAAAHLAGARNVKRFLRTNGSFKFNDAYGTTIEEYLEKFGGYDTSSIMPNRKPIF